MLKYKIQKIMEKHLVHKVYFHNTGIRWVPYDLLFNPNKREISVLLKENKRDGDKFWKQSYILKFKKKCFVLDSLLFLILISFMEL